MNKLILTIMYTVGKSVLESNGPKQKLEDLIRQIADWAWTEECPVDAIVDDNSRFRIACVLLKEFCQPDDRHRVDTEIALVQAFNYVLGAPSGVKVEVDVSCFEDHESINLLKIWKEVGDEVKKEGKNAFGTS